MQEKVFYSDMRLSKDTSSVIYLLNLLITWRYCKQKKKKQKARNVANYVLALLKKSSIIYFNLLCLLLSLHLSEPSFIPLI